MTALEEDVALAMWNVLRADVKLPTIDSLDSMTVGERAVQLIEAKAAIATVRKALLSYAAVDAGESIFDDFLEPFDVVSQVCAKTMTTNEIVTQIIKAAFDAAEGKE
jgi:hypothetical protein